MRKVKVILVLFMALFTINSVLFAQTCGDKFFCNDVESLNQRIYKSSKDFFKDDSINVLLVPLVSCDFKANYKECIGSDLLAKIKPVYGNGCKRKRNWVNLSIIYDKKGNFLGYANGNSVLTKSNNHTVDDSYFSKRGQNLLKIALGKKIECLYWINEAGNDAHFGLGEDNNIYVIVKGDNDSYNVYDIKDCPTEKWLEIFR